MNKKNKETKFWKMIENWGINGVGDAHNKGCRWFKRTFLPALHRAENKRLNSKKKVLLANAYYLLGDIYDFNHAPNAAIKSYLKSIEFYPLSGAWRELGCMYGNIGQREKCIQCIEKALLLNPNDKDAEMELKFTKDDQFYCSFYEKGDIFWQVNELLAENQHEKALDLLKNKQSLEAKLHRARIYGSQDDDTRYLNEWLSIAKGNKQFSFAHADWFFVPEAIWDSAEYWQCLIDVFPRLNPGVSIYDNSLSDNYYVELKGKKGKECQILLVMAQFNLYKCKNDVKRMSEMHKQFPKWKRPIKELRKSGISI